MAVPYKLSKKGKPGASAEEKKFYGTVIDVRR